MQTSITSIHGASNFRRPLLHRLTTARSKCSLQSFMHQQAGRIQPNYLSQSDVHPCLLFSLPRYKDKVKEKLLTRAEELRVEEEQLRMRIARNIELGKKAYEYGQYPEAVKFLEDGVNEAGRNSNFGGEGQLWLALAYQVRPCTGVEACSAGYCVTEF